MSIDNKHLVKIISINDLDYISKKTGMSGQMKFAQCVVSSQTEDRGEQIVVGELLLPKHLYDIKPGDYLADFELSIDQSKRIGTRLVGLHPIGQSPANARSALSKEASAKTQ